MKSALPLLALIALASCSREAQEPRVTVSDAVVTVPAVPGGMGAAYFTLETNREGTRLTSVASPSANMIDLHETLSEGGRTRMVPLAPEGRTFGPGEALRFAPGGKHAMLMGMDPNLRPGDRITLTLRFDGVEPVTTEAEVRAPGDVHAGH